MDQKNNPLEVVKRELENLRYCVNEGISNVGIHDSAIASLDAVLALTEPPQQPELTLLPGAAPQQPQQAPAEPQAPQEPQQPIVL